MASQKPPGSDSVFMKRTMEARLDRADLRPRRLVFFGSRGHSSYPSFLGERSWRVAVFYGYDRLQTVLGGAYCMAAAVHLLMLILWSCPRCSLADLLVSGAQTVTDHSHKKGELHIPPPPDRVAGWPGSLASPSPRPGHSQLRTWEKEPRCRPSPLLRVWEPGSSVPLREPGLHFCSLCWRY